MAKRRKRGPVLNEVEGAESTFADDTGPVQAPEYKAMQSKGIEGAERITLDQYEQLVKRGYNGDLIRRWTQHHAAKVLASGSLCMGPIREIQRQNRLRALDVIGRYRPVDSRIPKGHWLAICPHCGVRVREHRMARHTRKVHPTVSVQ